MECADCSLTLIPVETCGHISCPACQAGTCPYCPAEEKEEEYVVVPANESELAEFLAFLTDRERDLLSALLTRYLPEDHEDDNKENEGEENELPPPLPAEVRLAAGMVE